MTADKPKSDNSLFVCLAPPRFCNLPSCSVAYD